MKWREKVPQLEINFPRLSADKPPFVCLFVFLGKNFRATFFFFFHPPLRRLCQEAAAAAAAAAVETGLRGQTAHLHT